MKIFVSLILFASVLSCIEMVPIDSDLVRCGEVGELSEATTLDTTSRAYNKNRRAIGDDDPTLNMVRFPSNTNRRAIGDDPTLNMVRFPSDNMRFYPYLPEVVRPLYDNNNLNLRIPNIDNLRNNIQSVWQKMKDLEETQTPLTPSP